MMKIKISSDSTCDLSPQLIARHDIPIAPLTIIRGGEMLLDGVSITPDDIFAWTEENQKLVTTAAVNTEDYIDLFSRLRSEYDAVIHFTISSEMSSCYQNAVAAAEEIGGVYVIDTRSFSSGIGHLVLDACEMAHSGMDAEAIVREIERRKTLLAVSFVVDTLEYLRHGGRCSSLAAFGANLLHLKPSISIVDGRMGVSKKYRGSLKKCLLEYVSDKLADSSSIDPRRIFITHSGVSDELLDAVHEAVLAKLPFEEVLITRAGSTISSHCGPNCLGILFYLKG